MRTNLSRQLAILYNLKPAARRRKLDTLSEHERGELETHWKLWARPEQLPPAGEWRSWLIMAGRGFGKTRAGAEWVRAVADADPDARIALVGASLPEVRAVMVEGESGLLGVCPLRHRPLFEPSLRRIVWPNGAQALLYSAAEPETLRGPQHSHAFRTGAERDLRERGIRTRRCLAS
jgi:phage terminase large subunit-like protein